MTRLGMATQDRSLLAMCLKGLGALTGMIPNPGLKQSVRENDMRRAFLPREEALTRRKPRRSL